MTNEYVISKISDFLSVPEEEQEECLRDFFLWLSMARRATDLEHSLSGTMLQGTTLSLDTFRWIDDGRVGATAFNVIHDGQVLIQVPVCETKMDATHFSDARIDEIRDGSQPMTAAERSFLIEDTARFEECDHTETELAAMKDVDLMDAAYSVWREYVRSM